MSSPGQSRFAPRAKQFISKSDPNNKGDQSSPETRRISYHRSGSRGAPSGVPLPPIAHRRNSPATLSNKQVNDIKQKRSDGALSNELPPLHSPPPVDVQRKDTHTEPALITPTNHYNRTIQSEPRHTNASETYEDYSSYFDRAAYSAGDIPAANRTSQNGNSNRRRTSNNTTKNQNSMSFRDEGRFTSDEYEYEYEYQYERGPRNFRRMKPHYRNSSVKSRKAKSSPNVLNGKDIRKGRSSASASRYTINTVSSSESNSGREFSDNLISAEDGSPLSSRSLFYSESNSSHMNTMKKKKYISAPHKIMNSLRARYRYFFDQTHYTVFLLFVIAGFVTFSTFYTLAPRTLIIPNTQKSASYIIQPPQSQDRNAQQRKFAQNKNDHPKIVFLHDIHSHLAPSLTPTHHNIRANSNDKASNDENFQAIVGRKIEVYPAEFSDNTQFYGELDSADPKLSFMELREPQVQGECVPVAEWQTTFHPSCNNLHEYDLRDVNEKATLFGKKGYWRHAWHLEQHHEQLDEHFVLKTLKYEHNFEDAHFEHDRIDAVAMEMLTSSPHVINIFGFCGHSVVTEYADQPRIGTLADKNKKSPVKLLEIARDIANGIADVHGMGKNGDASLPNAFVHLDVNPANVVSVGGTLKLNDFNIGIMRKMNTTSNEPCGFPAQYPNPQVSSHRKCPQFFLLFRSN